MQTMTNERAVREYKWLVECVANQYLKPGIDRDDLVQEGALGLLNAVAEWKPDGGMSFETLARMRIRNAMRNFVSGVNSSDVVSLDDVNDEGLSRHELVGASAEQEDVAARHEEIDAVRAALNGLSDSDRLLLNTWAAVHVDATERGDVAGGGGAVPELARRMGIPRTTADYRCRSAMRRLCTEVTPFVDRRAA